MECALGSGNIHVEEGSTNENDPAPHTTPSESSGTIREEAENNYWRAKNNPQPPPQPAG